MNKCKETGEQYYERETILRSSDNSCSKFCESFASDILHLSLGNGSREMHHKYFHFLIYTIYALFAMAFCCSLYVWFSKYRLRYLLRLNCFVFLLFTSLNAFCFAKFNFQDWKPEKEFCFCNNQSFYQRSAIKLFGCFTFFMLFIRFHWSVPFNIKKKLHHVGFSHSKSSAKVKYRLIKQLTEDKISACSNDMPPVFPNGWIPVIESSDVVVGCSKTVSVVGRKFCVFRGFQKKVYILDAYCPHLGAELSAGGKVLDECIECPFHEWRFDGRSGKCLKIPYTQKIPDVAKIKTWPACENNGFIFLWYHAENETPSWHMSSLESVETGSWKFRGRTEHEVHCHIQEIPENGADLAHLHVVHSRSVFLGQSKLSHLGDYFVNCIEHEWQPGGWEPDSESYHIGKVKLSQRMRILGISLPFFKLDMDIDQIGPATVHLHMKTCFGNAVLLQHIIPEGPLNHRIIHRLYTEPRFQQFPADLFILSEAIMFERDIAIWNNKRYLRRPTLVKEDKLINSFRRWYSQFYSEHSPTIKDLKEKSLDW